MEEVAEKSASVAEGASASEETDTGPDRLETAEPDPRNPAEASGPEVLQVDREDLAADGQGLEVESGTKEDEVADGSVKKPESEVRSEGAAEAQDKMTSAEDKNVAPGDDVDTDNDVMEVDDSDAGEMEENKADEEKKPEPIEAKAGVNETGQNPVKAGDGDASSSDSGSIADLVSELIKPKPKRRASGFWWPARAAGGGCDAAAAGAAADRPPPSRRAFSAVRSSTSIGSAATSVRPLRHAPRNETGESAA